MYVPKYLCCPLSEGKYEYDRIAVSHFPVLYTSFIPPRELEVSGRSPHLYQSRCIILFLHHTTSRTHVTLILSCTLETFSSIIEDMQQMSHM